MGPVSGVEVGAAAGSARELSQAALRARVDGPAAGVEVRQQAAIHPGELGRVSAGNASLVVPDRTSQVLASFTR